MIVALEQGTSAAVGGAIATAVLFPLDVLRTKLAVSTDKSESSTKTVLRIIRTQGVSGLFGGLSPKLLQSSLGKFLYFIFYTTFVQQLQRVHPNASTAVSVLCCVVFFVLICFVLFCFVLFCFFFFFSHLSKGTSCLRLSCRGLSSSSYNSSGGGDDSHAKGRERSERLVHHQELVCVRRSLAWLASVRVFVLSARNPVCAV
jgi:hypothetical protein